VVVEQLRRRVPGGSGTYVTGLLDGLAALEAHEAPAPEITLYASAPRPGKAESAASDPVAAFGFPVVESHLPGPVLTRAWDTGIVVAPPGYDVIHGASMAVPRSRKARTIVTLHDLAWRHVPFAYPRHGRKWHEKAFMRALREGSGFVVPSEVVASQLIEAGAEERLVTVIEPGSDHLRVIDASGAEQAIERLGVRRPYMLSVATLEPRKNLPALFEAYQKIRGSLPGEWQLVVVGPRGWGSDVSPGAGVHLAGAVTTDQLSALYQCAELLAYVPLLEGYGLPPLEAMRAGIPVVASPIPSTGTAAFEVDPRRVESIAEGLLAVATDSSLRDRLVAAGNQRAATLTWEACATKHVALWRTGPDGVDKEA